MAFLFGKKKQQSSAIVAQQTVEPPPSAAVAPASSIPTTNGSPAAARDREKERGPNRSPTPNSSVNNSLNSLGGGATPSPEQKTLREKSEQDFQGPRSVAPTGPPPAANANASLYPWAQRRFNFTTTHPNPFPRYGAAVNSVANKEGDIYLMGGLINGSTVKGDLWLVEAGGGSLSCFPLATTSEGPGPRVGHASLIVGNAFIVYGGDTKMDDRDMLDDTLYLLNTSTRHWSRAIPAGPRPSGRYGHTLNIIGSKIYIFGGQVEGYFFNDLVAFDLNALQKANNKWEMLVLNSNDGGPPPGQIPPARTNHTVVTWEDQLYLFGGTDGFQWFNDVWTYDPVTNSWTQLDCIGYIPAPREGHAATLVGDVMYIFGGRTEEANDLGDLAAFRISSRRWYTFQNMGPSPSPRSGHSMTSYGKQIIVIGGEPSSAPRDAVELSLVYILDTGKIRYPPNDQQVLPNTAGGERGQASNRRPSGGEKSGIPQSRGIKEAGGVGMDGRESKRIMGPPGEGGTGGPNAFGRSERETNAFSGSNGAGPPGPGAGSRMPRISMAQGPPGPPPLQQAPTPRPNGVLPTPPGPRTRTPTRGDRGYGGPAESARAPSLDRDLSSPVAREAPSVKEAPLANGRRTPTQQSKIAVRPREAGEPPRAASRERSRSRQAQQQSSVDSVPEPAPVNSKPANGPAAPVEQPAAAGKVVESTETVDAGPAPLTQKPNDLVKELEAVKSKNAWLASEMAMARKAGYNPGTPHAPALDERSADAFGEHERPLIEALLALKAELGRVQGSVDSQAVLAAKQIAEVERQRDVAVSEAVYAKAKLAAHGGSQSGTPVPDSTSRSIAGMDADRSTELNRKLAGALGLQAELKKKLDGLETQLRAEKQARQLAEGTANAAQNRLSELDTHNQRNASEVEGLRAELHEAEKAAREEAARAAEAATASKLLQVDKDDLRRRLDEALGFSKDHTGTLGSLREAVVASTETSKMLEKKLEEERTQRENLERRLRQLRAEYEEATAELDSTSKRLKDAEQLGEAHAAEARKHRQTVLSGLGNITTRSLSPPDQDAVDERVSILQAQVDAANAMVKKSQAAADTASEKLRSAEERIAGLEAYQEQASRDGLSIRKQLQQALKQTQSLQAENTEAKQKLASHQLEANAITVQHGALKDLLGERGISAAEHRSRSIPSPGSGVGTPDHARMRDLEQQLAAAHKAHRETESSFEMREQDAERAYREKLEQLENDYQSAVHYVKGTEKMLKRMKDELAKYKTQNAQLLTNLEEAQKSGSSRSGDEEAPQGWDHERRSLKAEIDRLQVQVKTSVAQLEKQMAEVRSDLGVAREQRDLYQNSTEQAQQQLALAAQQSRMELEQLKNENSLLESRALDAEQKVSLLLDQVESSVDSYRRQSRQIGLEPNGVPPPQQPLQQPQHQHSSSAVSDSVYENSNRNSVALDSLASELDALRSHWETTNKNYRLSNTFDFEKSPPSANSTGDGELSGWSRSWREKLDVEERERNQARGQPYGPGQADESTKPESGSGGNTPRRGDYDGAGRTPQQESAPQQPKQAAEEAREPAGEQHSPHEAQKPPAGQEERSNVI